MKNIRVFVSENFQFLEVKFVIYLNRRVFVMAWCLRVRYSRNSALCNTNLIMTYLLERLLTDKRFYVLAAAIDA